VGEGDTGYLIEFTREEKRTPVAETTTVVAIAKSDGDYTAVVPRVIELAGAGDIIKRGDSVLIKPNVHAVQHWTTGGTTNPELVAALIDRALELGAGRILVADSPFRGNPRPEETFEKTGMAEAVERKGAEWTILTRHGFRIFKDISPHLPAEFGISELVFQFDKVIDVAVMKTHIDCLVTLGMKNLKGCIRNEDKAAFHNYLDIDRAIVELNKMVRPDLTIVDGTVGMEGHGPGAGTPVNFGYIFAGRNTAAVDAVAASAMGVEVEEARTLRFAEEAGLFDKDAIEIRGADLGRIRRRFERPYEAIRRELPDLRLQSDGACSACKLNVIRALRDNLRAGIALPRRLIVIGNREPADADAVLIGKCTAANRNRHPYLAGCPPRVEQIKAFLAAMERK